MVTPVTLLQNTRLGIYTITSLLKYLIFVVILVAAAFLTVVTQVGGAIYLASWIIYLLIRKRITKRYWRIATRYALFIGLYLITILIIMPPVAKKYGRVPLPFIETNHVRPLSIWTALLNRHYVRPELRAITYAVGDEMNQKYPGTVINYMDANFPFRDDFPLYLELAIQLYVRVDAFIRQVSV